MIILKIFLCITVNCFFASFLHADIYEWTDEKGVKHYSNSAPPAEAKIMMKTEELPYDEVADNDRLMAERAEKLELDRLELAERKAEFEWREAHSEQRMAEAGRQAEESLREAEIILMDTRNDRYDNRNNGYSNCYRGYYPYHYKHRYYYRNETGSIYFIRSPYAKHFKRYRFRKHRYGIDKKHRRSRYIGQTYNRYPRGQHSIQSHRRHIGSRHSRWVNSVSTVCRN
jgi:Domain of unknown function (DUF4124)